MGDLNSCFDHKRIKDSSDKIKTIKNYEYITNFSKYISTLKDDLADEDKSHEVLTAEIEALEDMPATLEKATEEIGSLAKGMEKSIEAYDEAEGSMDSFLKNLSPIIANTLGYKTVAKDIDDGKVKKDTLATTTNAFVTGATEEVKKFISDYAKYLDDNCPSDYASSKEWKEALEADYKKLGYSSYDASDLAYAKMAAWRISQTGAKVTKNAISEFAEEAYEAKEEKVRNEYNDLVYKYRNLGVDEGKAKELATAESEYNDASEVANESHDYWAYNDKSMKYNKWQKLKKDYGITEESSNNSVTASEQNNNSGTKDPTTDSGNGSGGGNSSGNGIQTRKTSTGTGNSSRSTNSSSQNNNSSSHSKNNNSSQNQNTPSNGTEEKPSNGNKNSVISDGEEKVPETPSNERPGTTHEPDSPISNNNNNNNANNSGTINNNNNTSNGGNSNYYSPSNNGNSNYYPPSNNGNSGGSSITGALTEGTTSIEDVIKGSKVTKVPTSPSPVTTTSSSSGSSAVIPIAAGLSAAAAAGIGAKAYMDRKHNNDNGEANEDENEFNTDEWSGDDSVDIQYDEDTANGENYLDDDDDYSYKATSNNEEKYETRSSEELADLQ